MVVKFYLWNKGINLKEKNSAMEQRRAYHYLKDKQIRNWDDFLFFLICFIEL